MDLSTSRFPIRKSWAYLNNSGIAPMYAPGWEAGAAFERARAEKGQMAFADFGPVPGGVRDAAARLLGTSAENLSFMKNTAEGLSLIAAGYPFEPGDEIISYIHEYPSNHYPYVLQKDRGVSLKLIPDRKMSDHQREGMPGGFHLQDVEDLITDRTRMIALSHVQFTSGFACDVRELGELCADRNIDLIIDGAQSMGCLPLYPEKWNVSAIAASGWKWMMGPVGTGLLYTSPDFRKKIRQTMAGADLMQQGQDYLNHSWQPHEDGRRFEYSTVPVSLAIALQTCLEEVHLKEGIEAIRDHNWKLQDLFLEKLQHEEVHAMKFEAKHRSGILSLICPDPTKLCHELKENGIIVTQRGGYCRIAPHVYNTAEDIDRAAKVINGLNFGSP
ncbi:MAG: aminotransferase class V-fold PLP-dependent enzyme [Leptospiraceae bacterium]|nr:aminotransferase class V-fold PLP-dependent enzyme [Leptospiraceae bacterium]